MSHRSRLSGFIIDCQTDDLPAAANFWGAALGMAVRALPGAEGEKYVRLVDPDSRLHIEVQKVRHESRVHLDIESDDIDAEVTRLVALGATVVVQRVQSWTVMQAPTGQRFCVVRPTAPDFALHARRWESTPADAPARPACVLNLADVQLEPRTAAVAAPAGLADRFDARSAPIGSRIGARQLGINLTAIPPGKAAWPFHHHRVNEELFLLLEGSGQLRLGSASHAVRAGDVISCPAGGPELAHQLVNTGEVDLKFIAISTMLFPEVLGYPDAGKTGVRVKLDPPESGQEVLRQNFKDMDAVGYWEGE